MSSAGLCVTYVCRGANREWEVTVNRQPACNAYGSGSTRQDFINVWICLCMISTKEFWSLFHRKASLVQENMIMRSYQRNAWDIKYLREQKWILWSIALWYRVVWWVNTNISRKHGASNLRIETCVTSTSYIGYVIQIFIFYWPEIMEYFIKMYLSVCKYNNAGA